MENMENMDGEHGYRNMDMDMENIAPFEPFIHES